MAKASKYAKYTREQLLAEVEKLSKRKKYGLVWEEEKTKEKFEKEAEDKLPVLVEDKKREIKTDPDKPVNILIEGDNYHALSVLNYTHAKSIDVIYIDPPYNTGNKDFKYNDKFIDSEDAYRHSKWLSFMSKRLKLAKKLLKSSGVIFISIDDNEQAQLKLMCDDIFGIDNFICQFIWNKKNVVQNDAKFVSTNHEYVICFSKKISKVKFNLLPRTEKHNARYDNPDNDPRGLWTSVALQAKSGSRENIYDIIFSNGVKWRPVEGTYPRLKKESLVLAYKEKRLWFGKTGKNVPRLKKYLKEVKQGVVSNSILLPNEVGSTQIAKEILKRVVSNNLFETPKPPELIKTFIKLSGNNKSKVLDFFAGSGTTGHAVLELNKEDGGNRQFIICTNNENDICTDVCYPRVQKVIKGYKNSKGEKVKGLGGNLKYYKTYFVDSELSHRNKKQLTDKSIEMLCVKENTFEEVLAKKELFIFSNKEKYTAMLFNERKIEEFKKEIRKLKLPVSVYVFSLEGDDFYEEFEDMGNDITLCSIPEAILKVYRRIYGRRKIKSKK